MKERKKGKKEGRKEGRKGGREGGREGGRKEGRKGGRKEGRSFSLRLKIPILYKITTNKTFTDRFSSYCHCSATLNLFWK